MHRSEVTVDLGAVRRNARTLLRALEGSQLWAVVKANAYGHGATQVARALEDAGADVLACADIEEGSELRAAGVQASSWTRERGRSASRPSRKDSSCARSSR